MKWIHFLPFAFIFYLFLGGLFKAFIVGTDEDRLEVLGIASIYLVGYIGLMMMYESAKKKKGHWNWRILLWGLVFLIMAWRIIESLLYQ